MRMLFAPRRRPPSPPKSPPPLVPLEIRYHGRDRSGPPAAALGRRPTPPGIADPPDDPDGLLQPRPGAFARKSTGSLSSKRAVSAPALHPPPVRRSEWDEDEEGSIEDLLPFLDTRSSRRRDDEAMSSGSRVSDDANSFSMSSVTDSNDADFSKTHSSVASGSSLLTPSSIESSIERLAAFEEEEIRRKTLENDGVQKVSGRLAGLFRSWGSGRLDASEKAEGDVSHAFSTPKKERSKVRTSFKRLQMKDGLPVIVESKEIEQPRKEERTPEVHLGTKERRRRRRFFQRKKSG